MSFQPTSFGAGGLGEPIVKGVGLGALTVLLVYSNEFKSLNPSKIVSDWLKYTDKTVRGSPSPFQPTPETYST